MYRAQFFFDGMDIRQNLGTGTSLSEDVYVVLYGYFRLNK